MNSLTSVNPVVFAGLIVLFGFFGLLSTLAQIIEESNKAVKRVENELTQLRAEFDEAVDTADAAEDAADADAAADAAADAEESDVESELLLARSTVNEIQSHLANLTTLFNTSMKRIEVLEEVNEEMKDLMGRLHTTSVTPHDLHKAVKDSHNILDAKVEQMIARLEASSLTAKDLERAVEGVMTFTDIKELLAELKETVVTESQEKAANMIFQSEAIQRRRLELVRTALESLTGHAEQTADFATREDLARFVREDLAGYATIASVKEAEETRKRYEEQSNGALRSSIANILDRVQKMEITAATAKEPEYYQGWMASGEMNGIKAEVQIFNNQLRTKLENKEWLTEDKDSSVQNREACMEFGEEGWKGWKQNEAGENVRISYKAGEWSSGVKTEIKLMFPPSPPVASNLPPPPPRDGRMCRDIFAKIAPSLVWEKVLLAVDSV